VADRYMLDTNTVSHIIKRQPQVMAHLVAVPMHSLCISAITAGELAFGLAKRPQAVALKEAVNEFLRRVEVMPWDDAVAQTYGSLRAQLHTEGTPLSPLDLQIAAHAMHLKAMLVTDDKAFANIKTLAIENWLDFIQ
jgi:tRNA(fMet)-specific endonuclease VapC